MWCQVKNRHLLCCWNFSESQILNTCSFCHCQQQPSNSSSVSTLPHWDLRDCANFFAWHERLLVVWLLSHFQPHLPQVSNHDTLWPINPEALGVFPACPAVPCLFADALLSAWNPSPFPTGLLAGAYLILKRQLRHFSLCGPSKHMRLLKIWMNKKMSELVNKSEWLGWLLCSSFLRKVLQKSQRQCCPEKHYDTLVIFESML